MNAILENQFLKVEIAAFGAELRSIFSKENKSEYLWQGDEKFWTRRAPVLFPIVGKLKNNSYQYQDKTWELSQHGFARDVIFDIVHQTQTSIAYSISHTPDSLKKFPFLFNLQIKYTLNSNILSINYRVTNKDDKDIFFSIGGHPGLNCPLNDEGEFSDYFLEFETEEKASRHLLTDGLFNGTTREVLNNSKVLNLNEDLFASDAIVFKNLNSSWVKLKSQNSGNELKFNFTGFPFLGIWKKKDAPFICIEPWFGLADMAYASGKIEDKEGIIKLSKKNTFSCEYSIEIN